MDSEEHTGNSAEKRKRKPNFTTRELTTITENEEANKGILQSKFTDNVKVYRQLKHGKPLQRRLMPLVQPAELSAK